jgi:HAD superfamily phosphoserine phosphatase-like hydrolase
LSAAAWKRRENPDAYHDYEMTLIGVYEAALSNISTELFDQLVLEVIKEYKDQTYTYTRNLITRLKKEGYVLFIVSGSHGELIEKIAQYYGFDDWVAANYQRVNGSFRKGPPVIDRGKDNILKALVKKHELPFKDSLAIGDSASDAAMLDLVEHPITFNPDKELLHVARARGWKIVLERKNVIYELESKDGAYILAQTNP